MVRAALPRSAMAIALAVVTAACSRTVAGTPVAAPSSDMASPSAAAESAPRVAHPKNLAAVGGPCMLLTPRQLADFGASDQSILGTSRLSGLPTCKWRNDTIAIDADADVKRGLSVVYGNKGFLVDFTPTEVDGFPAVLANASATSCGVFVGVADDQSFSLLFDRTGGQRAEYQDPCAFAKTIASDVLRNLPAAG